MFPCQTSGKIVIFGEEILFKKYFNKDDIKNDLADNLIL